MGKSPLKSCQAIIFILGSKLHQRNSCHVIKVSVSTFCRCLSRLNKFSSLIRTSPLLDLPNEPVTRPASDSVVSTHCECQSGRCRHQCIWIFGIFIVVLMDKLSGSNINDLVHSGCSHSVTTQQAAVDSEIEVNTNCVPPVQHQNAFVSR